MPSPIQPFLDLEAAILKQSKSSFLPPNPTADPFKHYMGMMMDSSIRKFYAIFISHKSFDCTLLPLSYAIPSFAPTVAHSSSSKDECILISINKDTYVEHLKFYQFSLIGRMVFVEGDKP